MPLDSIIFKGYEGDEKELEERIISFLNLPPSKRVKFMNVWTSGIAVYVMLVFGKGKAPIVYEPEDVYGKITATIGEY